MMTSAIEVEHLTVRTATQKILDDVSIVVPAGAVVGVIGESGSGKTTLARSLLGALARNLTASGTVRVDGVDMLAANPQAVRRVRRSRVAYVGQEPGAALTPTMRIGVAVAERLAGEADHDRVAREFEAVELPSDRGFLRRYPHELSGGQLQRVVLARALASEPAILVLDEPTTGLDVITQSAVLEQIRRRHAGRTMVVISHDLAVIARLADEVVVMRHGRVVEAGPCISVLAGPNAEYTRSLVAACLDPRHDHATPHLHDPDTVVLSVQSLAAGHRSRTGCSVVAAADVEFDVHAGECVALVGASGAGKSTIARALVGAHRRDRGVLMHRGDPLEVDVSSRDQSQRWGIQLVPQDPRRSLNPRRAVGITIADVVRRRHGWSRRTDSTQIQATVADLLRSVGLDPALGGRRPGSLSGGECQRVVIARALAARPDVLICDEVTSALDVSVQAGVLDLIRSLIVEHRIGVLFITHDLGVVARIADRVYVLDSGRVCEHGDVRTVLDCPSHDVTRALVAASPSLSNELANNTRRSQ